MNVTVTRVLLALLALYLAAGVALATYFAARREITAAQYPLIVVLWGPLYALVYVLKMAIK